MGVYPAELEKRATLKDGTEILLRPIKPTDERLEQELFYSLSDRTTHLRFCASVGAMPHGTVQYFTTIDYDTQTAIVAVLETNGQEQIVGVGRYIGEKESDMAELALLVQDDWQGKGLGTLLHTRLAQIAKSRNVGGFKAEILQDNKRALHVFTKVGGKIQTKLEDDVYLVSYRFQDQ